jgi:hypothetical protein
MDFPLFEKNIEFWSQTKRPRLFFKKYNIPSKSHIQSLKVQTPSGHQPATNHAPRVRFVPLAVAPPERLGIVKRKNCQGLKQTLKNSDEDAYVG